MDWSPQQSNALLEIEKWFNDPLAPQVFRLFGYAGSGKTTLAREIEGLPTMGIAQYAAFTGKAASVLRGKGCLNARTIHSLIYRVLDGPGGTVEFELWPESPSMEGVELLIIDEVSMVDAQLGRDLESFGVKILVLGDPAQLPPIKGAGYFTDTTPDFMLTEVHRQALDSPIVRLATKVRAGETIEYGNYGEANVIPWKNVPRNIVLQADQVLCGKNATRHALNRQIRAVRGFDNPVPQAGEKLICLRNDRDKGLLNGTIWYLHSGELTNPQKVYGGAAAEFSTVDPKGLDSWLHGIVREDEQARIDEETGAVLSSCRNVLVPMPFFFGTEGELDWTALRGKDQFTYGYAITVHKAQGSQWDNVVLYDESHVFRQEARRHLYTGITRAAKSLTIIR